MDQTTLIIFGIGILIALVIAIRLSRGKAPAEIAKPEAPATPDPEPQQDSIADAAATAATDVAGPLLGVDVAAGPADDLTRIKGLGPKAAAQLEALGVTRYDQLGELTPEQAERLDALMGSFKGRLARDRWIEQARLLAAGDTAAFEATFGKLGG